MPSVIEHDENLLAPVYTWMVGGSETALLPWQADLASVLANESRRYGNDPCTRIRPVSSHFRSDFKCPLSANSGRFAKLLILGKRSFKARHSYLTLTITLPFARPFST
jgi:hypothetical protein